MRCFSAIAIGTIFLSSCTRYAHERNFDVISLNMKKQEVMKLMDSPGLARGSIINKYGQSIEVREYKVEKAKTGSQWGSEAAMTVCTMGLMAPILFSNGEIDTYWLYFCDGQLVQWGKAGDWAEAKRQVYDINFKMTKE